LSEGVAPSRFYRKFLLSMPKMCEKMEEPPSRTKEPAPKMRDLTME
jgi:hypothetical protein